VLLSPFSRLGSSDNPGNGTAAGGEEESKGNENGKKYQRVGPADRLSLAVRKFSLLNKGSSSCVLSGADDSASELSKILPKIFSVSRYPFKICPLHPQSSYCLQTAAAEMDKKTPRYHKVAHGSTVDESLFGISPRNANTTRRIVSAPVPSNAVVLTQEELNRLKVSILLSFLTYL
jgi:hypothetical protein